jgi:hypothetical protein
LKNNLLFICLFCLSQFIFSQSNFDDADYIKSVVFKANITNAYTPIIKFGEELTLIFDDLNADERNYYYKIDHCNIDWTSSGLSTIEFINGFPEDKIREYQNSFNTYLPYTNYQLKIPNLNTKFKLSGNYIISIFNDNDEVVLKRRFIIYEPNVTVAVTVHKSRDISNIDTHQTVQFTINNANFRINNPSQEVMPVILQNNNWQTAITGLKPQFYRGNQLMYQYDKETTFWAGNEFWKFDTKEIRSGNIDIANVELGTDTYNTYLYTVEERIGQPYTLFPDINGNFLIRTLTGELNNLEADYSWVHFSLESLEDLRGKDVFVSGNFNNWALNNSNKLKYNKGNGLYEVTILMKQGFYNYQFVTLDQKGNFSNHDIDGSHYQTENDYTVLVYFRPFGARYTKVIGVGVANSKILLN